MFHNTSPSVPFLQARLPISQADTWMPATVGDELGSHRTSFLKTKTQVNHFRGKYNVKTEADPEVNLKDCSIFPREDDVRTGTWEGAAEKQVESQETGGKQAATSQTKFSELSIGLDNIDIFS